MGRIREMLLSLKRLLMKPFSPGITARAEDGLRGFRVTPSSDETARAVEIHERVMNKYDAVFRALAK
jgi:hypothetical protein